MGTMSVNRTTMGEMRNMSSLVWRLFAIIVILQACGINAKDLQNDLTFDDTFDIDQIDESMTSTKLRSERELDEKDLIEDELQPVDEADGEGSWLAQGVKRVRRELGRIFGASEEQKPAKKQHKKRISASASAVAKKAEAKHKKIQQKLTKSNRHQKRQLDNLEGSGDDDDDENIDDFGETDLWQTIIIVDEVWDSIYSEGKSSQEFLDLQMSIEKAFNDLFVQNYGDEEFLLRITLMSVEQHGDDFFKIRCVIQMDLPEKLSNFGEIVRQQLTTYKRMGELSAEVDEHFYFERVRDVKDHEYVEHITGSVSGDVDAGGHHDSTTGSAHHNNNNGYDIYNSHGGDETYGGGNHNFDHGEQGGVDLEQGPGEDDDEVNDYDKRYPSIVYDCDAYPEGQFQCDSGHLIPCTDRCDNKADCPDDTDEEKYMCDVIFAREEEYEREHGIGHEQGHGQEHDQGRDQGYDGRQGQEHDVGQGQGHNIGQEQEHGQGRDQEHGQAHGQVYGEGHDQGHDQVHGEGYDQEHQVPDIRGDRYDITEEPINIPEEFDCYAHPEGRFVCLSGEVIPCYLRCDGVPHCADRSDESPDECPDVNIDKQWNNAGHDGAHNGIGYEASGDGDVAVITETSPVFTNEPSGCRGDASFRCPLSNTIICEEQLCDGYENCPDGEDEANCPTGDDDDTTENGIQYEPTVCTESEFKCDSRCLPRDYLCNGYTECLDGTDEMNCPEKECSSSEFKCRSGNCIDSNRRCDHVPDCPDGDDEDERCLASVLTPEDCNSSQFFCDDDCHPKSIRCNGHYDCADRTDEQDCQPSYPFPTIRPPTYPCPQHTCSDGRCYSESDRCDGIAQCDDGADETDCCAPDQFRCRNGDCASGYAHCNGVRECADNSDEDDCTDPAAIPPNRCLPSQFRCDNGQCVSAMARCNGYTDCVDSSDERYCTNSQTTPAPQLNLKTYPPNQILKESREVVFRCRDEGMLRAKVRWTRPGGRPLPIGSRDKDGRLEIPNIRMEDSGTYICEAVGYPRHVSGQQISVQLTVEKYNPRDDRLPTACTGIQATCMNGECIDKSQICDGTPHCSDGSDEHSCSQGRKCQPNQFLCRNSKCVDRVWRCDGENDCGDNSDEESCDPEPSGAPCRYDEFQCRSGHCIPKSFQCDDTNDCLDGSDEIGCMAPDKIRDPPPTQFLRPGESMNLTCVGVGTPTPLVVWRLNWGHIPEKCSSQSYSGTGTLYCPDMQVADSGAYSCEIINSRGSKFATDTMVTVEQPMRPGVCPAGSFNSAARRPDECLNCFCFGISKSCSSGNLFINAIQPPITSHRVVNVELSPYSSLVINEASSSGIASLRHGVQFRATDVLYGGRSNPYLALPQDFMGNQLKSYGGFIKYDVTFVGSGRPANNPDVILTGNGFTLTYRSRNSPQPNNVNHMEIQFTPGTWKKPDGRVATREEIMMILTNVDNLLIRLNYIEATEREVELTNIMMNSAGHYDQGLGPATLVEQCACPIGYTGDSCETCAPGYVRQPGGGWLGRCVPFTPEPCSAGTYGDPRRGIPCRDCPCPQTGSNNFASGCSLGPDNEVTCNCNEGYTGRRCEMCATGYQGNPLAPGGRCYPVPDNSCNPEGTYSTLPNNTCECKPLVTGAHCDTCMPGSFHLNSFTYTGCIPCFCSGLDVSCGSSSWYRDQISSTFGRSRAPHGFTLIRNYNTDRPMPVEFSLADSSLTFGELPSSEPLYWSLPPQFLGNQITSYGGKLNYTLSYNPMPAGSMSRSTSPDIVLRSGEDLTIVHHRRGGVSPSQSNTYSVPIIESAWHRSDGQPVNRQHLLMALSKIDAIYIKATYTTSTKDGALSHVSLDTASATSTGGARAWEVEVCRCQEGYIGTSCERCAPGYTRNDESGLYLGICERCECNGHSDQCDPETGVCMDCRDNTEGEFCERCSYGYSGDATAGTPYDCQTGSDNQVSIPQPPATPRPSPGNMTCYQCNQEGTSSCYNDYCYCKSNVQGPRCDQCKPGTFGMSANNPEGCDECYCSHKSSTCRSASLYRQLIPIDFVDKPPLFTDEEGLVADTENLSFDIERNEYTYSYTSYTPKYWSLRGSVLGNQLYSYGGVLSYQLSVDSYGHAEPGNDVVLIGNGLKLIWSRPSTEQDSDEYTIRLHEDENWQTMQRGVMQRSSREYFMTVLSNLEHILIRATPKIPTTRTAISDVILESAVETPQPGAAQAIDIEICSCPSGYTGSSCESCSPMHYRDSAGNCVECPCQDDTSTSCRLDDRGYVKCQCRPGYSGDRCQIPEYETEPSPMPTPVPDNDYRTRITVSIAQPEITIIPVGGSITLSCTGRLAYSGSPVIVSWYKLNGNMPYGWEQDDGYLRLYDLQIHDSGIYICQAKNNQTQRVYEDQVSITITENSRRSPPKIENLPSYYTFDEYLPNEINCEVSGNPTPTVVWTRVNGQVSSEVRVEGSRLIFEMPRKSDEGNYRCQASNGEGGYAEQYTQIFVQSSTVETPRPPREHIYIDPPSVSGESGEFVRLTCQPTTSIVLKYEWTKDGYPIYRQHNLIINGNMLEIRESTPRDSGVYTCIGIDQRGRHNYTSDARVDIEESRDGGSQGGGNIPQYPGGNPPVVTVLPEQQTVIQGYDFTITCDATGTPRPTIRWTKVHESLGENVHQNGNVLRITNARPDNRGIYLCIAENDGGTDQTNIFIDIEPRERPIIEVQPKEPQVLSVGSQGMLYCTATGIPQPRVVWTRVDGKPMSPRHQIQQNEPGYIIINDIALADAGDYKCVAENEVGNVNVISTIRVIEAPTIQLQPSEGILTVTEGDEVKIACTASGYPTPSVRWGHTKDVVPYSHLPQPNNQVFLEFYRVSMQDAKQYTCIATNEAGDDERYIVLDVRRRRGDAPDDSDVDRQPYPPQYPPQSRPQPQPQPRPENVYQSKPGDNVTLYCGLTEAYETRWERVDGRPLPTNSFYDRNSLIIHRMNEQNAGKYRCNALDNRGTIITFHLAELVYIPIPHITLHPQMPMQVNVNENVDISCDVDGAQPISVSWHTDNNRPLPSSVSIEGKYLRFIAITPAAAGRYYCSASNRYGNSTEMAEVIVNRGHAYEPRPYGKQYELSEGDSVRITCDVEPTSTPIRGEIYYNWRRDDNQPLPPNSEVHDNDLFINNLRKQDEGRYICESYTATSVAQQSYADLFVKREYQEHMARYSRRHRRQGQ